MIVHAAVVTVHTPYDGVTHQQNSKVSEVIATTVHFLCSLIEHSTVTAIPCTKAICVLLD